MQHEVGRICSTHGEIRNAYKILPRRLEVKRRFEILRCSSEDNLKVALKRNRI
jgi:hypothetical protein